MVLRNIRLCFACFLPNSQGSRSSPQNTPLHVPDAQLHVTSPSRWTLFTKNAVPSNHLASSQTIVTYLLRQPRLRAVLPGHARCPRSQHTTAVLLAAPCQPTQLLRSCRSLASCCRAQEAVECRLAVD